MLAALSLVVPLGLGGALSPVMFTEQTVLLGGPGGRRAAAAYAGGVLATVVAVVSAIVLVGRSISLPTEPRLSAPLDLALGLVLLLVAGAVVVLGRLRGAASQGRRAHGHGPGGSRSSWAALASGSSPWPPTSRRSR